MPGVILLRASLPLATAIDEMTTIAGVTEAEEWVDQIAYVPLR